jgi:hypothetical protein
MRLRNQWFCIFRNIIIYILHKLHVYACWLRKSNSNDIRHDSWIFSNKLVLVIYSFSYFTCPCDTLPSSNFRWFVHLHGHPTVYLTITVYYSIITKPDKKLLQFKIIIGGKCKHRFCKSNKIVKIHWYLVVTFFLNPLPNKHFLSYKN